MQEDVDEVPYKYIHTIFLDIYFFIISIKSILEIIKYLIQQFYTTIKDNKLSWECHTRNPSWVGQIKMLG